MTSPAVRVARSHERHTVAAILARAFADDPVVRFIFPDGRRIGPFYDALMTHEHCARGSSDIAHVDGEPAAAAAWDPPGHRPGLWHRLVAGPVFARRMGPAAAARGQVVQRAMDDARPDEDLWYLALLGAVVTGQGCGSALLEHRLATVDGPAYLENSNARNTPLYERFGFEITREIVIPDGPTLWGMYRRR
ncbi:GNAT family N-acetyltransferase [Williamsia herbipolensis]|uniref:GNAT family N-acetyltransferase n=1 Tax=Williamsia herbipolensis TaxID=1603258 RepID=A0AAU4JWX3_9NOCA|nr:GNAT family N-acetyltransferase [Williamsia herbipolensis]